MNAIKTITQSFRYWSAIGFLCGLFISVIILLNIFYVKSEKTPIVPTKDQAYIINKARKALEEVDSSASAYFCSSIENKGEYYLVNFNDDCGNIKLHTPFFEFELMSPCINDNYVKVHNTGLIEIEKYP